MGGSRLAWDQLANALLFLTLREEVKEEVDKIPRPDSLDEFMELVIAADNRVSGRRNSRKTSRYEHQGSDRDKGKEYVPYRPRRPFDPASKNYRREGKSLGTDANISERREIYCFTCGEHGHTSPQCKSPQIKQQSGKGRVQSSQ